MVDPIRQEVVALAHTVVVKVGTNVLAGADGRLERERIQALVEQLLRMRATGKKVILVSSGAIGAGTFHAKDFPVYHRRESTAALSAIEA